MSVIDGVDRGRARGSATEGTDRGPSARADGMARDPLPLDVVFELLANARRRWIIRTLRSSPGATLGELAVGIAAVETDVPPSAVSAAGRKRVYVSLYQSHLPKLTEAGVVRLAPDGRTIEPGDRFDQVVRVLRFVETGGDAGRSGSGGRLSRVVDGLLGPS